MTENKPKSINSLMKYLREDKGIAISGSADKQKLMSMGYYHGYKGYRYFYRTENQIPYTEFGQLTAVYDFDTQMKTVFYPLVMQIEAAMKNYTLEVILAEAGTDRLPVILETVLNNYQSYSTEGKTFASEAEEKRMESRYKNELKKHLDLRNRIYRVQSDAFEDGNPIATHFLNRDVEMPIWAIFELLSLGEFGHLLTCMNQKVRCVLSQKLGVAPSEDPDGRMPQRLVYVMRDLRNAVAHNSVIFDTRFRTAGIDSQVSRVVGAATGVRNLTFETITDYVVLAVYMLNRLGSAKAELRKVVVNYISMQEKLKRALPEKIYQQIIHTDGRAKAEALRRFLA